MEQVPPSLADSWKAPTPPSNLESVDLTDSDPDFIIDTDVRGLFDNNKFGLPIGEDEAGKTYDVIAVMSVGDGIDVSVVKETNKDGLEIFSILGRGSKDPDDIPNVVVTFATNQRIIIGRRPEASVDNSKGDIGISLERLGYDEDLEVSRNHLAMEWDSEGSIAVHSTGKNGTKIEAVRNYEHSSNPGVLASGLVAVGSDVRVDRVRPDVSETAVDAQAPIDRSHAEELERKYAPTLQKISDKLVELTEGLSTEDKLNLRGYHHGHEASNAGWEQGNGDKTAYGEDTKTEYYKRMTPAAQRVAEDWAKNFTRYEQVWRAKNDIQG